MLSENLFIDGVESKSESAEQIDVSNPADTREIVGRVPKGTREDARRAIESASRALQENSRWSSIFESRYRGALISRVAKAVEENKASLAKILTLEQGKPIQESMAEFSGFVDVLEYYSGFGGKIEGRLFYSNFGGRKHELKEIPHALGVCAAITPWNFPISLLGWKMAPALIAGNAVIVKPSITTPLATIELAKIMHSAGLPKGIVNVLTGPSNEVGEELVANPLVRKVAFTGSTETGKRILAQSAKQIKYVTLELGGSDPMIICDDANVEAATTFLALSGRYKNCGQACTSVKRLYVFDNVADIVEKSLIAKVGKLIIGRGDTPGVTMGPMHTETQRDNIESLVENAIDKGAKTVLGGDRPDGEAYKYGHFYKPTLLTEVDDSARIWSEECFGPVLPIQRVANLDEAIEKANHTNYGLGSSIWSTNAARLAKFEQGIESGMVWENSGPTPSPEVAFGGVKDSGIGRELGTQGLFEFLEFKTVGKPME